MSELRQPEATTPLLRIVRGEPSAHELAALTALLAARSQADSSAPVPVSCGGWNDPSRALAPLPLHGPNAWRSSAR